MGYGFSNIIGAFLGCLPTATYSQNCGYRGYHQVVNRVTLGLSALIILVAGLFPKILRPSDHHSYAVLGGATVSVFASITTATGMRKTGHDKDMNYRHTSIVGLVLKTQGMGVSQASASLSAFKSVTIIFGKKSRLSSYSVAIHECHPPEVIPEKTKRINPLLL